LHDLLLNTIRSARAEIMLTIFPFQTRNTNLNQIENALLELLLEVTQKHNVKVRLLIARDASIDNIIEKLEEESNIEIQFIEPLPTEISSIDDRGNAETLLLIVDKQSALALASKENDLNNSASSATPAAFFSDTTEHLYAICTSKADVLSHVAAFDSLWMQSGIQEKLKNRQKTQDEFLNVAAHELRTPIQPILGLTEVLRSKIKDSQQQELLDVIIRNAKKLQQLSEDILEVTRIESKKLLLNRERFNLNDIIYDIVQDYKNNLVKGDFNRKLVFEATW
jgi:two-component system sensor histidine kinase VicK